MINKRIFKRCFHHRGKRWLHNIKEIPVYISEVRFLKKNGYDSYALWETGRWFIDTMKDVLSFQRNKRLSSPILLPELNDFIEDEEQEAKLLAKNEELWNGILDKMSGLLAEMDENDPVYEDMDLKAADRRQNAAKNEFFKLFSEHFYDFWD